MMTEVKKEGADAQVAKEEHKQPVTPIANEVETLTAALKAEQTKYLYLYAEFENYKKRTFKERSELIQFGHERLLKELLHIVDNLDRALEHVENVHGLIDGIKLVNQELKETLAKFGVKPIEAKGKKFDPEHHEAVGQEKVEPAEKAPEEGSVLREHQKGYMLHGRLLRPARVVIATATSPKEEKKY